MVINRDIYLNRLIERKHNGLIKVVTGIRRCGKSFLLNELFTEHLLSAGITPDHIISITTEGIENIKYRDPEYTYNFIKESIIDNNMYYIIIDEVQMMDAFTEVLNSLSHIKNTDIYVTGSNSRFLSSDIATEFRGRGDVIQVHPLRFAEFMTAYEDRQAAWDDFYTYGGMPQVLSYSSSEGKEAYLTDLFNSTYIRDIVERNKIKKERTLDELIDILASGIGSYTNPTKLQNTFKSVRSESFPHSTIDSYIDCLVDAFIVSKAQKYNIKGKKYIETPYKIYFEDVGLRNARLNFRQVEENHIMENIIYNDLVARGYKVDVGIVEFFSKDASGKTIRKDYEVDFVVNRGSEKYYIQSAFEIPSAEKMRQETNSLRRLPDSFRKMVVIKDYMKPKIDEDGIYKVGLINFLLADNILS